MTPDERILLSHFLDDLVAARGGPKDGEADNLIHQALAANPDAAYLLVQHAILADQALHTAQDRIADLERQLQPPAVSSASFLPPQTPGPWDSRPPQPYQSYPQDYAAEPRPGIFSGGGGLGSFLRSAGTMAAGVAGGEMLFSGLSGLFGRHQGGSMFGGGQGFLDRPEEVVVNNYGDGFSDGGDLDDRSDW
ncbi:DUF2076 domain-containing protein [Flavisphingomonas formosensis]|uniref:DUF2076 domain-containing protein n=1 Tax=Flavisphingomonas formosensis TaxID=861534 RepID=UPI0012FBBB5E|nr:DUF2076 domain-containing protein [Sphingomonas formosensis]